MKKITQIYSGLLIFFILISTSSCNKWIDSDINISPNDPKDVSMDLLLPAAQGQLAFTLGGDLGRYTSIYMQQNAGVDRQHSGYDSYNLSGSDVDNAWQYNLYAGAMQDFSLIIKKAAELNSPNYAGVAKVLMAIALGNTTDLWGDVPYSEAFLGAANLKPKYDSQQNIYATLQTLLSEAVADLDAESVLSPGDDDLIYGGDLASWTAAANSLKARYALHLSEQSSDAYANALAAIDAGSIENGSDANFYFTSDASGANPWFKFNDERGDIRMGKFFIDLLNNTNDPRIDVLAVKVQVVEGADTLMKYVGSAAGVPNANASTMGSHFASSDSPVPFVTYAETKFIEAEAAFQTNNKSRAAEAYNNGVLGSCSSMGVEPDAEFIAAQASETDATITLEKIMTQKYIAMYGQPESWTDFRRTNLPALQPAEGQDKIPTRFDYPQSEVNYNSANVPSGLTKYDRIWLDKN